MSSTLSLREIELSLIYKSILVQFLVAFVSLQPSLGWLNRFGQPISFLFPKATRLFSKLCSFVNYRSLIFLFPRYISLMMKIVFFSVDILPKKYEKTRCVECHIGVQIPKPRNNTASDLFCRFSAIVPSSLFGRISLCSIESRLSEIICPEPLNDNLAAKYGNFLIWCS